METITTAHLKDNTALTPAGASASAREQDKNRRIGREIAYGLEQTLTCFATDFIDPPVSKAVQNGYDKWRKKSAA